jgi:hypothetical protein
VITLYEPDPKSWEDYSVRRMSWVSVMCVVVIGFTRR